MLQHAYWRKLLNTGVPRELHWHPNNDQWLAMVLPKPVEQKRYF